MPVPHHKSQGAALISALFITAIAAILATAIAVNQRLLIFQSELMVTSDQSYLDLQGVQDWAIAEILTYSRKVAAKQKAEFNPRFGPRKFNQAELTGLIIDQQGFFNINSLVKSAEQPKFADFLRAVDARLSPEVALRLAKSVTAWLNKSGDDAYYFTLTPPYRSAHRQMIMISELRAVKGFNAKLFLKLKPYLTAIPLRGKAIPININTASAPVIAALLPTFDLEKAEAIYHCRQGYGEFIDINTFNKICVVPLGVKNLENITTHSSYFILRSQATLNNQQLVVTSFLVTQKDKSNKIKVRIAWQSLN